MTPLYKNKLMKMFNHVLLYILFIAVICNVLHYTASYIMSFSLCIFVGTWLVDGVEAVTEVYTGLSMVKIRPNFFPFFCVCVYVANHQMATFEKKKERKSEIHWLPLLDFFLVKSCAWFVSEWVCVCKICNMSCVCVTF